MAINRYHRDATPEETAWLAKSPWTFADSAREWVYWGVLVPLAGAAILAMLLTGLTCGAYWLSDRGIPDWRSLATMMGAEFLLVLLVLVLAMQRRFWVERPKRLRARAAWKAETAAGQVEVIDLQAGEVWRVEPEFPDSGEECAYLFDTGGGQTVLVRNWSWGKEPDQTDHCPSGRLSLVTAPRTRRLRSVTEEGGMLAPSYSLRWGESPEIDRFLGELRDAARSDAEADCRVYPFSLFDVSKRFLGLLPTEREIAEV